MSSALKTFWASNNNRTGIGMALCTFIGAIAMHITKNSVDAAAAVGFTASIWKVIDPDFIPMSANDTLKAVSDLETALTKPTPSSLGVIISDGKTLITDAKGSPT